MLEIGTLGGLAVKNNYDAQIDDLKYLDHVRRQNDAMSMAKTKMFMDDLSFQNGSNPYDAAIIKSENYQKVMDLAKFTRENPDWVYNQSKAGQVKLMKEDLKSSPAILRSVAYKEAIDQYNKDLTEALHNPQRHDMKALEQRKFDFDNYNKFGHQGGEAGFAKEGAKPMVYQSPEPFIDEVELYRKSGDSFNHLDYSTLKNGRDGAFTGTPNEDALTKEAQVIYQSRPRQFDQLYREQGVDPIKAIADGIRPHIKREYKIGERNPVADQIAVEKFKAGLKASAGNGQSAYDISILNTDRANPGADYLAETFTSSVPNFYKTADGKVVQNKDDVFHYDGDIHEAGYGSKGYKRTGVKEAPGYFIKSLDWGQNEAKYLYDPWGTQRYEVKPEFKDFVKIIETPPDKEGKTHEVLKVSSVAKINANNPMYRNRFDSNTAKLTTKQRDAAGVEESTLESNESYDGNPVGSVIRTTKGNYLVTSQGYIKQ